MQETESRFWLVVKYLLRQGKHWLAHWLAAIPYWPVWITSALVCQNSENCSRAIGGRFSVQIDGSYKKAAGEKTKNLVTSSEIHAIKIIPFPAILTVSFEIFVRAMRQK
jgi:hypothetical protein